MCVYLWLSMRVCARKFAVNDRAICHVFQVRAHEFRLRLKPKNKRESVAKVQWIYYKSEAFATESNAKIFIYSNETR